GRYVKIRHNSTYTTQYLHMSKIASGIKSGARVKQGDVIGYVGSTGLATGNHLCYRFWKNGVQIDALKVELPPSEPITEAHKAAYEETRKAWNVKLDEIVFPLGSQPVLARSH
ncbi:MAG: M23 family metallopeptidase, partial [Fulvivirga sp.]|nr:M23 family metallopeptidase [Fulvivirga sp.]